MASEKQAAWIMKLIRMKDLSPLNDKQKAWCDKQTQETLEANLPHHRVQDVLDTLRDLDWKTSTTDTPTSAAQAIGHNTKHGQAFPDFKDGYYAISVPNQQLKFYTVKRWKKNPDILFVKVWASDNQFEIKDPVRKTAILTAIANDPDAGPRFGREIGNCYVCGRTLTDELSRSLGIGPICRGEAQALDIDDETFNSLFDEL